MPILRPNSVLSIPAEYIQLRIRNYSDTEYGSCTISTAIDHQDYTLKPYKVRVIKLQRGAIRFENTGRTELSIRFSKKPFLSTCRELIFPSHLLQFLWSNIKINE